MGEKLKNSKNRCLTVNKAVSYYFAAQEYLKKKEKEFILGELDHFKATGEHYTFEETFSDE